MNNILSGLSWLVTVRPWLTLAFLLLITVLLAAGATRRAQPPETAATLPKGNAVAEALVEIDDLFGDSGDVRVVTLLFRGDTLTPGGLAQMAALLDEIVSDPAVNGLLAPVSPVMAPTSLVEAVLQVDGFESITQVEDRLRPRLAGGRGGARRNDRSRHRRHAGRDRQHPHS